MIMPAEEVIESMDVHGRICVDIILMYLHYQDEIYVAYANYDEYLNHQQDDSYLVMEYGQYNVIEHGGFEGFAIADIESDDLFEKIGKFFNSIFNNVIPMELL